MQWNWFSVVTGCTWFTYISDVREPISLHQTVFAITVCVCVSLHEQSLPVKPFGEMSNFFLYWLYQRLPDEQSLARINLACYLNRMLCVQPSVDDFFFQGILRERALLRKKNLPGVKVKKFYPDAAVLKLNFRSPIGKAGVSPFGYFFSFSDDHLSGCAGSCKQAKATREVGKQEGMIFFYSVKVYLFLCQRCFNFSGMVLVNLTMCIGSGWSTIYKPAHRNQHLFLLSQNMEKAKKRLYPLW